VFLVSNVRTDEWPGTKLIGHEAMVRRYRVSDESVMLLINRCYDSVAFGDNRVASEAMPRRLIEFLNWSFTIEAEEASVNPRS
jgi:hypothetical protein